MTANEIDFEELFRRISSPQTSERFKALRLATTEDLASTFKPSAADSEKTEGAAKFPIGINCSFERRKKSDLE